MTATPNGPQGLNPKALEALGLKDPEAIQQFITGIKARFEQPCEVCGLPMLVARGQIAKYHGKSTSPLPGGCRQYRHRKNQFLNKA